MARELLVVGVAEVAEMLGKRHTPTVSRWLADGLMPEPDARLLCGPIWRHSTIERWAKRTGRWPDADTT